MQVCKKKQYRVNRESRTYGLNCNAKLYVKWQTNFFGPIRVANGLG